MPDRRLVIVKHPPVGDGKVGTALCNDILARIRGVTAPLVMFHDATEMSHASADYAAAFMALDKQMASQLQEIVCAIPRPIPRMMAYTVAVVSSRQWRIFKTPEEAFAHLAVSGFGITKDFKAASGRVVLFSG